MTGPEHKSSARLAVAFLAALVLGLAACQTETSGTGPPVVEPVELPLAEAPSDVAGLLVYPEGSAFRTFDPATGSIAPLASFPSGTFAGMPAASPDGGFIAFGLYRPGREAGEIGGTDLYVMATDGSDQRPVLAHDSPGASLGEPAWAPDGEHLYVTRRAPREPDRIERVPLDGSESTVVVEGAHSPTVSADGQLLAYLATDLETYAQTLWVSEVDGSQPRRLLGPPEFRFLSAPRFAPDGDRIAFGGVTIEDFLAPSPPDSGGPVMRLGPRAAHAHGVPYELRIVNADGTGLEQLTDLQEHAPTPAWSPDGRWIAFSGELGMYLVDPEQRRVWRVTQEVAMGGLTWLAP